MAQVAPSRVSLGMMFRGGGLWVLLSPGAWNRILDAAAGRGMPPRPAGRHGGFGGTEGTGEKAPAAAQGRGRRGAVREAVSKLESPDQEAIEAAVRAVVGRRPCRGMISGQETRSCPTRNGERPEADLRRGSVAPPYRTPNDRRMWLPQPMGRDRNVAPTGGWNGRRGSVTPPYSRGWPSLGEGACWGNGFPFGRLRAGLRFGRNDRGERWYRGIVVR